MGSRAVNFATLRIDSGNRVLSRVQMLLVTLLAIFLTVAIAWAAVRMDWSVGIRRWLDFGAGSLAVLGVLLLLYQCWQRQWLSILTQQFLFFHRLNHELAHALAALLTGAGISGFAANAHGGCVQVARVGRCSAFVALAPYLLSLPLIMLILFECISPTTNPIFRFLLGMAYFYHVMCILSSVSSRQSDFRQMPYPLCLIWIACAFVVTSSFVVALVCGGRVQMLELVRMGWHQILAMVHWFAQLMF